MRNVTILSRLPSTQYFVLVAAFLCPCASECPYFIAGILNQGYEDVFFALGGGRGRITADWIP